MITPQCPVHGPMRSRHGDTGSGYTGTIWYCPGWDGEGCPARVITSWSDGYMVTMPEVPGG